MLVTFSTDAYASITIFGDVALSMLEKMGCSATVPGAIQAPDVAWPAYCRHRGRESLAAGW